jgi:hypothetical protein
LKTSSAIDLSEHGHSSVANRIALHVTSSPDCAIYIDPPELPDGYPTGGTDCAFLETPKK